MAGFTPATPTASLRPNENGGHTRPPETSTPSNIHANKRVKNVGAGVHVPPIALAAGKDVGTDRLASSHLRSKAEEMTRIAACEAELLGSIGEALDNWEALWKGDDQTLYQRKARIIVSKLLKVLDDTGFDESEYTYNAKTVPETQKKISQPATGQTAKSPSWATLAGQDIAATNIDVACRPRQVTQAKEKPKQEDLRIIITTHVDEDGTTVGPPKQEPYLIRTRICKQFQLPLSKIPDVRVTRHGYSLRPADATTRDKLVTEEAKREIERICGAVRVALPQKWFTYVVPQVPCSFQGYAGGEIISITEGVEEEAFAQTGKQPISCRRGWKGLDPITGRATWVISFLEPVRQFRLFNASAPSFLSTRKRKLERHTDGCQGYCTGRRCYKMSRCGNCAQLMLSHAPGICEKPSQCVNCHGPFPAGHEGCPAMPVHQYGRWVHPTRKALVEIRRIGSKRFDDKHASARTGESARAGSSPETDVDAMDVVQEDPSRKRGREEVTGGADDGGVPESLPSAGGLARRSSRNTIQPSSYNERQLRKSKATSGTTAAPAGPPSIRST